MRAAALPACFGVRSGRRCRWSWMRLRICHPYRRLRGGGRRYSTRDGGGEVSSSRDAFVESCAVGGSECVPVDGSVDRCVNGRRAGRLARGCPRGAEEGPAAAAAVVVMVGWIETVIPLVRSSLSPQSWTATVCTHACTHACMHAPTPSPVRACLQRVGCRLLHS
eukprot:GHVU01202561.1.p2 GENE.GHVU01202561.1~~GHVU01202561.1.p2  ORF type:complete len:165 (+),score=1.25 GHVU01202561.1:207-701(+)